MKAPIGEAELLHELDVAEQKAIESLARYKFQMFGYWAAIWVHLNRISGAKRPNPFREYAKKARETTGWPIAKFGMPKVTVQR